MFIYFHKRYLSLGTSLSNLLEMAEAHEVEGRKPDAILVFGVEPEILGNDETVYYEDKANGVIVGIIGRSERVDYFGYLKKMALTLHNLLQIDRGNLPIHGAMANIVLRDGHCANVVLMGTAEPAVRSLEACGSADEHLRDLTVVFDDMGTPMQDGRVVGIGTDGAFVRLDDLQPGYAYAEVEKYLHEPHKTNARIVIPVHPMESNCRLACGYISVCQQLRTGHQAAAVPAVFSDVDEALGVCNQGARYPKAPPANRDLFIRTANPFGAPQKRNITTAWPANTWRP